MGGFWHLDGAIFHKIRQDSGLLTKCLIITSQQGKGVKKKDACRITAHLGQGKKKDGG